MKHDNSLGAWPRCPQTAQWFARQYQTFADANPPIRELEQRFLDVAGVNIRTLVDHWVLPDSEKTRQELEACGLILSSVPGEEADWPVFEHRQARFPRVRLAPPGTPVRLAVEAENVEDFFRANHLEPESPFQPHLAYHRAHYVEERCSLPAGELIVLSRTGYRGFRTGDYSWDASDKYRMAREGFWERDREDDQTEALAKLQTIVQNRIAEVGQARAVDDFFYVERLHYQGSNKAARWQYLRQEDIGIGWANHDHHTYRSSRQNFRALLGLFLTMGFEMRERFYAGAEAGWGAQILEHPVSRVVIFADVDMAPDELETDFANEELPPRDTLGTIGLWCALHGDSIGGAGMHHLEAEFDYERARANLQSNGYPVMAPFTDLPMLKQAFTVPEVWPVAPERLERLRERGQITPEQAEKFAAKGAPGSHLEILQRWDGFKGFNKTGVSAIIQATDARSEA